MTMKSEIYLTKKKRRTFNLVYHQQDGSGRKRSTTECDTVSLVVMEVLCTERDIVSVRLCTTIL